MRLKREAIRGSELGMEEKVVSGSQGPVQGSRKEWGEGSVELGWEREGNRESNLGIGHEIEIRGSEAGKEKWG